MELFRPLVRFFDSVFARPATRANGRHMKGRQNRRTPRWASPEEGFGNLSVLVDIIVLRRDNIVRRRRLDNLVSAQQVHLIFLTFELAISSFNYLVPFPTRSDPVNSRFAPLPFREWAPVRWRTSSCSSPRDENVISPGTPPPKKKIGVGDAELCRIRQPSADQDKRPFLDVCTTVSRATCDVVDVRNDLRTRHMVH